MQPRLARRSSTGWLARLTVCILVAISSPSIAAVFEVNNTSDLGDTNPGDGICESLLGFPLCTLRAAIEEANALPNEMANPGQADLPDRIEFNLVPPGVYTIDVLTSALPDITESLVIDGSTQPGSVPNSDPDAFNAIVAIELSGPSALSGIEAGFRADAPDVEIKGIAIRGFDTGVVFGGRLEIHEGGRLQGCIIEDNFFGVSSHNNRVLIGGSRPQDKNVISGNEGAGVDINADFNTIFGNLVGTDPQGLSANPNGFVGISAGRTGTTIVRNLVSGHIPGVGISLNGTNAVVQNNLIGTDRNGTSVAGLGNEIGMQVGGTGAQVGGAPTQGNVIGGSLSAGISVLGTQNSIDGNFIGATQLAHANIGNAGAGIDVFGDDNSIGSRYANVIQHNQAGGIVVHPFVQRARIRQNVMLANGSFSFPGIDLRHFAIGVTPNDPGDPDEGSNRLQNFPILDAATRDPGTTHIEGELDSLPGQFRLDFYASLVCHPTGQGEGEQYLGTRLITLPGDESFSFDFPVGAIGPVFTAIATDAVGNSSEWSPCLSLAGGGTADLGVGVHAIGGDLRRPDEPIEFEIRVTNPGPLPGINGVVLSTLPPGLDFVSADPAATSVVGQTVRWDLGTVAVSALIVLKLTTEVDTSFVTPDMMCLGYGNDFTTTAVVGSSQLDLNPGNDQSGATVLVQTGNDLTVALTPMGQSTDPSTLAPLTVSVRNDGPDDAFDVAASGTAPGVDCALVPAFDSCDPVTGEWSWLVGDLPDGDAASLDFTVAAPPTLGGETETTALVTPIGDPTCKDIMTTARVGAGLSADLEIIRISRTSGWGIHVYNPGPDPIERVRTTYWGEPGAFAPGTCEQGNECFRSGIRRPGVPVGEELFLDVFFPRDFSFRVHFRVTAFTTGGSPPFSYEMFDPNPANNEASAVSQIGSACGLVGLELLLVVPVVRLARRFRRRR